MFLQGVLLICFKYAQSFEDMPVGPPNFIYHNFTDCAKQKTPVNLTIVPSWKNETYQILNGYFSSPEPLGNNLLIHVCGYAFICNKWIHMANISDALCHGLQHYVGPIRDEVLRSIGLMKDTCPIPAGNYRFNNVYLDWKKSRLPAFPYGTFKFVINAKEKRSKVLYTCLQVELENKAT